MLIAVMAHGHMGHHHGDHMNDAQLSKKPEVGTKEKAVFTEINSEYQRTINQIILNKCSACHGNATIYPWYHKLPWIGQMLDKDIAEAREHLNFTPGFPFQGHGTPLEDLEAIRKSVVDGTMPPLRYRVMHWNSGLTDSEKTQILKWIDNSIAKISN